MRNLPARTNQSLLGRQEAKAQLAVRSAVAACCEVSMRLLSVA